MKILTQLQEEQVEFGNVKSFSQSGGHLNIVFNDSEALRLAICKVTNTVVNYGYLFDMQIESNTCVLRLSQDWHIIMAE